MTYWSVFDCLQPCVLTHLKCYWRKVFLGTTQDDVAIYSKLFKEYLIKNFTLISSEAAVPEKSNRRKTESFKTLLLENRQQPCFISKSKDLCTKFSCLFQRICWCSSLQPAFRPFLRLYDAKRPNFHTILTHIIDNLLPWQNRSERFLFDKRRKR